jgi:uncharacterized repeat protein (TIGR01451 family)
VSGVGLLRLSSITGTGPAPVWAVLPGSNVIPNTGFFYPAINYNLTQINAAQPGTATRVSTNDPRLLNAVFRNGHLWTTHSAGLPFGSPSNRTVVLWYELLPALPTPILQSGVIDGGTDVHHYFPSISVNLFDEVVIGFSRSSPGLYVEAVYTSRQPSDVPGTVGPLQVIKVGEDSYVKDFGTGAVRWGDFSATVVDPWDMRTMWTIQEYAAMDVGPNPNDDRWSTWWGKIQFNADIGVVKSMTVQSPLTLTYQLVATNFGPADASGVQVVDTLPLQVTYASDDCSAGPPIGQALTWQVGSVLVSSQAICNVVVTLNPGTTGWVVNTAALSGLDQFDNNPANDQSTFTFSVPAAANDAYNVLEDGTLAVVAPGVLANDTDPDGGTLSAVLDSPPTDGTLA